ncbi:MAG: class II aldolase/adducin family protein [Syntrophorhabdaceae bacterium]
MLDKKRLEEFVEIGRDMFLRGLVNSHAGNMSIRDGNTLYITRTGSMLGRLTSNDIVGVDLDDADDPNIARASMELVVHRAIYQKTGALAVVHAHPPYATLLSMAGEIVPIDSEGSYRFKRIRVATPENTIASHECAKTVSGQLGNDTIVLVRAHGSFARGATLEEAYMYTSVLESAAFYVYHTELMKNR